MNNAIYMALLQVQKEIGNVSKDKSGQYKYTSLPQLCEHAEETCNKFDIFVSQGSQNLGGEEWFYTRLIHGPTGQMIESTCLMFRPEPKARSTQQEYGSTMTYLRRYHLMAILGIAGNDELDDDGGHNSRISQYQLKTLNNILSELAGDKRIKVEDNICKQAKIDSIEKLPWKAYKAALEYIEKSKAS